MAQIIKHRRGQLSGVKTLTSRNAEFIIASGSISDLNGPFVFIGSPNGVDEGVAGAFKSVSKIYQGSNAPTISAGSYGSILDGTPFYASGNESLYILNNDGAGGNTRLDLTGNIEGNLISGVTINNITGTTANIKNISGSFTGSGQGLYNIPASGITGLELNRISDGSATASISQVSGLRINTNTEITGALNVNGNITGSNMYLSGDAKIDGNITLGGNITVGDSNTDFVTFGAEISSSIVPDVHNAFDLGSSDKNWRDIHVSGTAYIENINLQTLSLNSLALPGDLTVSGTTILSGSVFVEDLTNNRVVIAGLGGQLEDDANFTFDGTKLSVGQGLMEIDTINGDIRTSGSLLVKSGTTVTGSFKLHDSAADLTIVGNGFGQTYFQGNGALVLQPGFGGVEILGTDPNLKVGGTLQVNGATQLNSTLDVTGSVYIKNDLSVSGSVTLGDMSMDSVTVSGSLYTHNTTYLGDMNTSLGDALIVSGGVKVSGSQFISNDLSVSGSVTLGDMSMDSTIISGTLYTHNTTYLGDTNTSLGDALIVSGTIKQVGDNNINGKLSVSGSVDLGKVFSDNTIVSGTLYTHNTTHVGDMNTLLGDALIVSGAIKQTGNQNIDGNVSITGSLTASGITNNGDLTVNGILTVTGNTQLGANLYVSGNLEVLGSSTNVILQSSTVEIGDNIILVNAYSPFQRYAGIAAYDSGSNGYTGSLLWDSLDDYWLYVNSNGQSSKMIGTTNGTFGSETSLTSGTFPIASGNSTIGDSLLTYSGTTLAFNTNKFTIDSGNGNTMVSGNFTLSYSGGTDNTAKTSGIMFRNSTNVVGFVSTTETTDVLDGILGYKHSDGGLIFSTVIDGGTY